MGSVKRYLEDLSDEIGCGGSINAEVVAEATRLINIGKESKMELTESQKRNLRWAYENAEGLSLEDGGWQNDSAAVVDTASNIMWLLEQAFPFLGERNQTQFQGDGNDEQPM